MSREIVAEIQIDAPAQRVWEILIDFEAHSSWNPFIRLWKSDLREGAELEVSTREGFEIMNEALKRRAESLTSE